MFWQNKKKFDFLTSVVRSSIFSDNGSQGNQLLYPVNGDLHGGYRYPPIEQVAPRRIKVVRRTVFFL